MQNISDKYQIEFQINSLLVNPLGRLGLYATLNLLQETAWKHADTLGFGLSGMEKEALYFVLTRQSLNMTQWPRHGAEILVKTWLRPPEGPYFSREFSLHLADADETPIGVATTSWLALDKLTKKPLRPERLNNLKDSFLTDSTGLTTQKISFEGEFETLAKFRVRNSDLDINQHVNNTRYAQWILDSIPFELHKKLRLNGYSVNFLAETHLGDSIRIERLNGENSSTFRGVRLADDKVMFSAVMLWEEK